MKEIHILGVKINSVTMDEAAAAAEGFFSGGVHTVFTPNPEIIMLAQKDAEFKAVLNAADLTLADGIGVVIASRLLKKPLPERVAGFDFVCRLLRTDRTFYLLGAKPGVSDEAAKRLAQTGVKVVGAHHGYFDDDSEIIADIIVKKPDILLVCLGAPKQEKWIAKNKDRLNVSLCLGAGGTLDVLAGSARRAPVFFQRVGLEWLYRAAMQPSRLLRLAVLPKFLIDVIRGGKAC